MRAGLADKDGGALAAVVRRPVIAVVPVTYPAVLELRRLARREADPCPTALDPLRIGFRVLRQRRAV